MRTSRAAAALLGASLLVLGSVPAVAHVIAGDRVFPVTLTFDDPGVSDEAWADYLFMRKNPKGIHFERWCHVHGCRRWFNVARDTVSHRILAVYRMGDPPPPDLAKRP